MLDFKYESASANRNYCFILCLIFKEMKIVTSKICIKFTVWLPLNDFLQQHNSFLQSNYSNETDTELEQTE